jgi:hypothetical protein
MLLLTYRPLGPPILLLGYQALAPASRPNPEHEARAQAAVALGPLETPPPRSPVAAPVHAAPSSDTIEQDEPTPRSTMPPPPPPTPLRAKSNDAFSDSPPPPGRPRTRPEVQVDPRTVFKQKPRPSERLEPRAPTPSLALADQPITDIVIVPQLPTFRASEQAIKSLVSYLRATQILVAKHQKSYPDTATGIELLPDVFSHLAFTDEGSAPTGPPCIAEGYLWFGPKPMKLPFGPARESCFRLDLVGVRYPRVSDAFVARLNSMLYLRAEVHAVPHEPRRLRKPTVVVATEPIPLFDVQER